MLILYAKSVNHSNVQNEITWVLHKFIMIIQMYLMERIIRTTKPPLPIISNYKFVYFIYLFTLNNILFTQENFDGHNV